MKYKLYKGSPTVTCNDYNSLISFDIDGEFLSGEAAIRTFAQQHYAHNGI